MQHSEPLSLDIIHKWDDDALLMLYRNFYKALVAFSCQMVEEVVVAEEIVQDAFVKTWQHRNHYTTIGSLRAWLYNTVRNDSISYLRHQKVESSRLQGLQEEYRMTQNDADDHLLIREETFRQLLIAIDKLPARQRQLFLLSIEGKTSADIAEEMGITVESVKKQRQRGISRLRDVLNPESVVLLLLLMK